MKAITVRFKEGKDRPEQISFEDSEKLFAVGKLQGDSQSDIVRKALKAYYPVYVQQAVEQREQTIRHIMSITEAHK